MQNKLTPTFNDTAKKNGGAPPVIQNIQGFPPALVKAAEIPNAPLVAAPAVVTDYLKVAIIGTAPSSRMLAPFNDPTWKIWACSPGNKDSLPRVDAWFEVHGNMLMWPENQHYGAPFLEWLRQQTFPIYMQDKTLVPNAIPLPVDELVREFGPYFFTSSFAWMMGKAIKDGAKEIALFGVDMASREEYILQRPGGHYFICEAQRRGIKIMAPYESDIMQPPSLYGYSEVTPFGRKCLARKAELQGRLTQMKGQRDSLSSNITYIEGALEDIEYVISIWGGAQSHNFSVTKA